MIWSIVFFELIIFLLPHAKRQTGGLKLLALTNAVFAVFLWNHPVGGLASALFTFLLF